MPVENDNIVSPPHYRPGWPQQIVTADTARQGPKGRRVLVVLLASMFVLAVAWMILIPFMHLGG
jgi:hypothetical protein